MGLLVVEILDPVLDSTQEVIGLGQLDGGLGLHQPVCCQALQAGQRGSGADLGELSAAHHQQQLDDELDLADTPTRELHVIGALGSTCGTALGLFTNLAVQLAQALEDAIVQVAPVDKGRDQRAQRQRPARCHGGVRRDHPALEPGEPLPFAALDLEILLQHRQADHRRTRVAIRTQCQVDAEDEAVVSRVPDQRVQALGDAAEVFVGADAGPRGALSYPGGLAIVFIDIDQVDVGRHVQLACAELAHADDPEIDQLAFLIQRRSAACVLIGTGRGQRDFQRDLGQQRHRSGDLLQCRGLLHIEHGQTLEHELAQHP